MMWNYDANEFVKNQNRFPAEELAKYKGWYVAWAMDGKSILAASPDHVAVYEELDRRGVDSETYIVGYVDPDLPVLDMTDKVEAG